MASVPLFTKAEINRAGVILADATSGYQDILWAAKVMNNLRAAHTYPINTFQATLRQKLRIIDYKALVAQRLKRSASIIRKLQRYPNMQLARMQDIGGLRAVCSEMNDVTKLYKSYKRSRFTHSLVSEKDYIQNPKESGYRGIHLIYRYHRKSPSEYNGLLLELQLRTRIQHAWATAVETMGTFLDHSLKSSEGPEQWLSFFSVTGSAFGLLEKCPPGPEYKGYSRDELFEETAFRAKALKVGDTLSAYRVAVQTITDKRKNAYYFLIVLNIPGKSVSIHQYSQERLKEATDKYLEEEQKISDEDGSQVVLVSVDSIDSLRRAYPNYFLDTHAFVGYLNRIENLVR